MSLATAIKQVIEVRGLTSGKVTRRLGKGRDYTTFFRLLNGRTTDPRVITLVRLCVALETNPSELLELAEVWSPETRGRATTDDLRLRVAFGQVHALPVATQRRVVPLVEALATGWLTDEDDEEESLDEDAGPPDRPAAAGEA